MPFIPICPYCIQVSKSSKILGMGTYILDSDLALRFLMNPFTDAMIILHRAYPGAEPRGGEGGQVPPRLLFKMFVSTGMLKSVELHLKCLASFPLLV